MLLPFRELRDQEMKILDDDRSYDPLQALAIGHALAHVQEPLRSQKGPRQLPGSGGQRPNLLPWLHRFAVSTPSASAMNSEHTLREKVRSIPRSG